MRFFILYEHDKQDGATAHHSLTHVYDTLSAIDGPTPNYFEAQNAEEAIGKGALALKQDGRYYAMNLDGVIVADDVRLQMEAVVPGIAAIGVKQDNG